MSYPGNSSLPSGVQTRIRSTFEHTLVLAEKGSRQEALLGCDFVLRMDPQFEPARRLQERLESASGPVPVDDLRRDDAGAPAAAGGAHAAAGLLEPLEVPPGDMLWGDLDGLAMELPEVPEARGEVSPAALCDELEVLLGQRKFQEIHARIAQVSPVVASDLTVERIVSLAHERQEAAPYVSKFLGGAQDALRAGNAAEAGRLIEKARSLDPSHPGIAELTSRSSRLPTSAIRTTTLPTTGLGAPGGGAGPATGGGQLYPGGAGGFGAAGAGGRATGAGGPGAAGSFGSAPGAAGSFGPVPGATGAFGSAPGAAGAFGGSQGAFGGGASPGGAPGPARGGDSDTERRIRQLLDEGQASLDAGDPQAAVDAWSRIFLIDIDHQEAAQRIEAARRMKAERDRQVEEALHDGLARLDAGDAAGARGAFERVIAINPGHLQAREYLQQMADGHVPVTGGRGAFAGGRPGLAGLGAAGGGVVLPALGGAAAAGGYAGGAMGRPAAGGVLHPPEADLQEEILVPPEVQGGARVAEPRREVRAMSVPAAEGRARHLFFVIGIAVLLLAVAVGWYIYQKRDQWFPNSHAEEPAAAAAPNPIPRAVKLHATGKVAGALAQLRRIAPGDPHYKEAQDLIAQWQKADALAAGAGSAAAGASAAAALPEPQATHRQALLDQAHLAYQDGIYFRAAERLAAANQLAKLDADDAAKLADAEQRLVPLQRPLALFHGHDWEMALPELWRFHEASPANKDATRLIADCYYDMGVRDLQRMNAADAVTKFTEAKNLVPDDPEIDRQLQFAATYVERPADMLYRVYVKYLAIH